MAAPKGMLHELPLPLPLPLPLLTHTTHHPAPVQCSSSPSPHPQVPVQPPIALPVISAAPVLTANEQLGDVFVSTVFVGNISDRASDGLVRQILMVSGVGFVSFSART